MMCKLLFGILVVPLLLSTTPSFRIKAKKRSRVVVDGAVRSINSSLNKESSLIAHRKEEVFNSAGGSSKAHSARAHEINSTGDLSLVALARKQEKAFSSVARRTITQHETNYSERLSLVTRLAPSDALEPPVSTGKETFEARAIIAQSGNTSVHSVEGEAHLKPLRAATSEQISEILAMAIQKLHEADFMKRIEKEYKEAKGDSVKTAKLIVSIYNSIVKPILSVKGFQETPVFSFLDRIHHVVKGYAEFINNVIDIDEILGLWVVADRKHKEAQASAQSNASQSKKAFKEANAEQIAEILDMAIERAHEVEDLEHLGEEYEEVVDDPVKTAQRLVSVYNAVVRPILSSASSAPCNLSSLQEAHKDDHGDSAKMANVMVSIYNWVVPPVLSEKGFEQVPILEFLDGVHRVAGKYAQFLDYLVALDGMMHLGTTIEHMEVPFETHFKPLIEATPEEAEEILSKAIQRAAEPDNLALLMEAGKKAHGDFVKTVQLMVPLFNKIVQPILSAKQIEDVTMLEFMDQIHQLADGEGEEDNELKKHIAELAKLLEMEQVDEVLSMAFHMTKEVKKLSMLGDTAEKATDTT